MQNQTIKKLIDLNTSFYQEVEESFDQTRQAAWPGWKKVADHIKELPSSLKLLDVACGNGRFGVYLHSTLVDQGVEYVGIDNNRHLLTQAQTSLHFNNWSVKLLQTDILSAELNLCGTFDVITVFGFMHHIPSFELRKKIITQLSNQLKLGGLLAISFWQFTNDPRWQTRMTTNPDLEVNDFLLDWKAGKNALRYCHLVDKEEQKSLITELPLKVIARYAADGADNQSNDYLLLTKSE